jgi:hypothetical protein
MKKLLFFLLFTPSAIFGQFYVMEYAFTDPDMSDMISVEGYIDIEDEVFEIAYDSTVKRFPIYKRGIGTLNSGRHYTEFFLSGVIVRRSDQGAGVSLFYVHNNFSEEGVFFIGKEIR